MKQLYSIEALEPHHVIDTGCRPLLVFTNEIEHYLVKYSRGNTSADMLAREFIAAKFCALWNIPFPEQALVTIKDQHLSPELGIGIVKIKQPGFGTLWNKGMKELDKLFDNITTYQSDKFINLDIFLTIAFFDIWMSNDDRNSGNYNLMIRSLDDGYEFVAIDHGAVFHTGNQDKLNYPISFEDSLLNSPLVLALFKKKQLFDNQLNAELKKSWYICASSCKEHYEEIINSIPQSWNIDKPLLVNQSLEFLMNDDWFETCWQTYLKFLQRIKNR